MVEDVLLLLVLLHRLQIHSRSTCLPAFLKIFDRLLLPLRLLTHLQS